MAQNKPIISYTNGFYASNTDPYQGPYEGGSRPVTDPPNLISTSPNVPNPGPDGKGNLARQMTYDTLSSGTNPNSTADALIGILSSAGYGQHWGTQHTTGGPGLSAVGVLWSTDATYAANSDGSMKSSSGVSRSTRVIHLSTPNRITPHTNHRNTTIITWLTAAVDLAVVYRNGTTATYTLSSGTANINAAGNGYTGHGGLSATGEAYSVETNVGPNIRRLVALGYR